VQLRGSVRYRLDFRREKLGKLVGTSFWDCTAWELLGGKKLGTSRRVLLGFGCPQPRSRCRSPKEVTLRLSSLPICFFIDQLILLTHCTVCLLIVSIRAYNYFAILFYYPTLRILFSYSQILFYYCNFITIKKILCIRRSYRLR
jgi:hypothetical protein